MSRPALLALCLCAASAASSQTAAPPSDLPPLPAALQGAWEMVEAPAYDDGPTIHRMTLLVEGHRITQRDSLSLGDRHAARDFTAPCTEVDGAVACWPSDRGTRTGYGGLGRFRVDTSRGRGS